MAVAVGVALAAPTSVPAVFDADPLLSGSAEAAGFIADPPIAVRVDSAERLARLFDRLDYRL